MQNVVTPTQTTSVISAARQSWRLFLPLWVLPVALFWSVFLPGFRSHFYVYFFLLLAPVFYSAWFISHKALRNGSVTLVQYVLLGIVAPIAIWVCVVGGFWAFALWGSSSHAS
jgi:hypothetical protein